MGEKRHTKRIRLSKNKLKKKKKEEEEEVVVVVVVKKPPKDKNNQKYHTIDYRAQCVFKLQCLAFVKS